MTQVKLRVTKFKYHGINPFPTLQDISSDNLILISVKLLYYDVKLSLLLRVLNLLNDILIALT